MQRKAAGNMQSASLSRPSASTAGTWMEKVSLSPRPQKRHPHSLHCPRLHSRRTSPTRMSTRQTPEHQEDAEPFSEAPSRSTLHISLRSLRSLAKSRGVMCNHKLGLHHGSVWNGCCGGTTVFYLDLLAVTLTSCASDLHRGRTLLPDVWSTK